MLLKLTADLQSGGSVVLSRRSACEPESWTLRSWGVGADVPLAVEFGADPAGQRVGGDVAEVGGGKPHPVVVPTRLDALPLTVLARAHSG
jgi:hypothetical protein